MTCNVESCIEIKLRAHAFIMLASTFYVHVLASPYGDTITFIVLRARTRAGDMSSTLNPQAATFDLLAPVSRLSHLFHAQFTCEDPKWGRR